ncbi:MAG: flagellin [Microvirga sp.]|jgi:flagellin|nr:flagellin [Beijerinckiaceae bacterium]
MSDITLSRGVRQNLLSLQKTAEQQSATQMRLATGRKVNSALDNPTNFFVSEGLKSRASDLSRLLDAMGLAVKTLEAADTGITGLKKLVETAQAVARQAKLTSDPTARAAYAAQFDALRTQIDDLAKDSGYNGVNLIKGSPNNLTVVFNEQSTTQLTVNGAALDTAGLGIAASANNWAADADIDAALTNLDAATLKLRTQASTFGANLTVIKNRQEFTNGMILSLTTGADGLVLADQNEEGANLLALNTRQQLSQTALSLAAQADQAVLRLFG